MSLRRNCELSKLSNVLALEAVPVRFAVIVPAEKLPLASRNTIVLAVFASVALEVTVKVPPSELTDPERPLPLVAPVAT